MHAPMREGFYPELQRLLAGDWRAAARETDADAVNRVLSQGALDEKDFALLLSPAAEGALENMARRAQAETLRNFGRGIQLFTPLYLANYCTNRCVYCGFSTRREIRRRMLSLEEVEAEAKAIAATGLRKILALTGDDPKRTGAPYLADCLKVLARHFSSVSIEVPSMTVQEYALQVAAGAEGMTMFQETYDRERYKKLHPGGPKADFHFRLDAPERALLGGMRSVNLGPLLGIADWREDVMAVAAHARFLMRKYPQAEVSLSLPRMRPHTEGGEAAFQPDAVSDVHFVQILTALRCYLPQCGITLSSREPVWLRDRLLPLGITRISAGVNTAVGGHAAEEAKKRSAQPPADEDKPQFDISDGRSVAEMAEALRRLGFQPVYADWLLPGRGEAALNPGIAASLGGTPEIGGAA